MGAIDHERRFTHATRYTEKVQKTYIQTERTSFIVIWLCTVSENWILRERVGFLQKGFSGVEKLGLSTKIPVRGGGVVENRNTPPNGGSASFDGGREYLFLSRSVPFLEP